MKQVTDSKSTIAMMFATIESCTVENIKQRNMNKAKMAKGMKVPRSLLKPDVVAKN